MQFHPRHGSMNLRRSLPLLPAKALTEQGAVAGISSKVVGRTAGPVFEGGQSEPKAVAVGLAANIAQGQELMGGFAPSLNRWPA